MLLRTVETGWLAITQPAHARLSAQIALAWGADWTAPVAPREHVVAGTLLHDIGWIDWEAEPTLNTETGLPHTFLQLPIATHIGMWRTAGERAMTFGRYPALLTSMHGTRLYGSRDLSNLADNDAKLISRFLEDEYQRQTMLIASLRSDPHMDQAVEAEQVAINSQYVALWDALSLFICGGIHEERSLGNVPSLGEAAALRIKSLGGPDRLALHPWPFRDQSVTVTFDARHIGVPFAQEAEMRAAMRSAPWQNVVVELVPASQN